MSRKKIQPLNNRGVCKDISKIKVGQQCNSRKIKEGRRFDKAQEKKLKYDRMLFDLECLLNFVKGRGRFFQKGRKNK